jgi:hypothetical protein
MRKLLAVPCLFVLFLFAACSNQPLGPNVTQAQADLHVAEQNFARAQSAIISLARAGVLKGDGLAKAKQAEGVAYEAIKVARAAVDSKSGTAISVVSAALAKVLELVAIYAATGVK